MMPIMASRSERVVKTLSQVDPEFVRMAELIYGPGYDPEQLWQDVYGVSKANPDQSDTGTSGGAGKFKRGLALAGVGAGALLGVGEVSRVLPEAMGAESRLGRAATTVNRGGAKIAGKLVPSNVLGKITGPKARLGVASTALLADGLAGHVIGEDGQQKDPTPYAATASKAAPHINQLAEGRYKVNRALIPTNHPALRGKFGEKKSVKKASIPNAGKGTIPGDAAELAGRALRTKTGAVVTASGLGLTAYRRHQKKQAAQYDPYAMYKRADDEPPAVDFEGTFSKLDEDKRLAFGYASVVKIGGQPVVDRQGDLIEMDDIEKAAYDYVQKSRKGGAMHKRDEYDQPHHVSDLVESFVITDEKVAKMGLPEETPRGWWVGFKVNDDDAWQRVRKGEWTGFSIHGKGKRVEKSLDDAMGY